ncbi:uncharacterized protein LOC119798078 [Cyprinodon tularosa]|uniref:uncharacterized protein LOC119798078 n=1 Tax=Cyprinodon tularosa TaxID=77115 RepID=UPI0018E27EBD|nr:uncharacterized protein LOC119798078 [Cyprinodon tularosa]XP_038163345.1 uncharacterized protein LOC119798078 [Cyprinodon tularosa]
MKMLVMFYLLLLLRGSYLTSGYSFVVKTANARENVTMKCPRSPSTQSKSLFWVKFSSVKWPEFLGQTITLDYDKVTKTRHLTSKQEEGTFILHIKETQQNDTGLYYCIKVEADLKLIFVNGIFLKINGPEPEVSTVTQEQLPDSLRPGESVTLQCSVFFHCKRKNCPTYHRVHWFKAGSDESHPSLIYVDGKSGKDCDGSPEAHTCVYRFSKMVSHSDAGTYYCAVATYEEIVFGNGTKLKIQELRDFWRSKNTLSLCVAVASCLVVILCLVYIMKKKTCFSCNDAIRGHGAQHNEGKSEQSLVYSAPNFTRGKGGKAERRKVNATHDETVYTSVIK